jgi:hypothetical protein
MRKHGTGFTAHDGTPRLRSAMNPGAALLPMVAAAFWLACTPVSTTDEGDGSGGSSGAKSGGASGSATNPDRGSGGSTGQTASGGSKGTGGSSGGTTGGGETGTGGSGTASGGSGPDETGSGGTSGGNSGGSSGTTDAGGGTDVPMAGTGTGAPGCQGVTAKFCSDFEMQTAGGAPNGNGDFSSSGAVTVDGAKGFSGTKSLHFKPGGKSQIKFTKQFPLNEEYGRLMIFVTKTPPNASHWDIVQSNTSANIWSWGGMYGKFELVVDPPDDGKDSSTPFPDGKWSCIQWKFSQGTGGKSEYHVKMDGAEVNQSPVNGHWKATAWKDLAVGYEVFGSAPIEFWVDDLAFGEQEIPCPAAK